MRPVDGFVKYILIFVSGISAMIMLWIFVCVLFFQSIDYIGWVKKEFLLPNFILFGLAIISSVFIYNIFIKGKRIKRLGIFNIYFAALILFILQIFISYNIYFKTGWDAGDYVLNDAFAVAKGKNWNGGGYYTVRPNNTMIMCIEAILFKIIRFFIGADSHFENAYFYLVIIQCLLFSIGGILLYKIILRACDNRSNYPAIIGYTMYAILVLLSPWTVVVYTDGMGIIVPLFLLWINIKLSEVLKKKRSNINTLSIFLSVLFGAGIFIGYSLKATTIIIAIACFLFDLLSLINSFSKTIKSFLVKWVIVFIMLVLCNKQFTNIHEGYGIYYDSDMALTGWHYLMMGANEECDGAFNFEDTEYSMNFATYEERKEGDLKLFKKRIKAMLPLRIFPFYMRKTLANYNDGTFGYGNIEGEFYKKVYKRNSGISNLLRYLFYDGNEGYKYVSVIQHGAWIFVLFGDLIFTIDLTRSIYIKYFKYKNSFSHDDETHIFFTVAVCMIGIFMFVMLFEGRARYLFVNAPIYIIAASLFLNRFFSEKPV